MTYKILAIDDHADTLSIVVMTLTRFGYEVVSTHNPVEGVKLAETEHPDLALIDMNMPVMNGIEVVKQLRQHPELSRIPIIMFTAENQPEQKKAGFAAGVDDYLLKPTMPAEMLARIEEMLEGVTPHAGAPSANSPQPATMLVSKKEPDYFLANDLIEEREPSVIAVIGVRGGVGTTTLAINLATLISAQETAVTLVDLDLQQGHIGFYLNQMPTNAINTLIKLAPTEIEKHLASQIIAYRPGLQLLLARPNVDGRFPYLSETQIEAVLNRLQQEKQTIIADLGHAITDHTRPALARADHVLLCFAAERVSLSVAKHLLSQLATIMPAEATMMPILIENGSKHLPLDAISAYINHDIAATIPFAPAETTQAINKATTAVQLQPHAGIATAYHQVATKIISKVSP